MVRLFSGGRSLGTSRSGKLQFACWENVVLKEFSNARKPRVGRLLGRSCPERNSTAGKSAG